MENTIVAQLHSCSAVDATHCIQGVTPIGETVGLWLVGWRHCCREPLGHPLGGRAQPTRNVSFWTAHHNQGVWTLTTAFTDCLQRTTDWFSTVCLILYLLTVRQIARIYRIHTLSAEQPCYETKNDTPRQMYFCFVLTYLMYAYFRNVCFRKVKAQILQRIQQRYTMGKCRTSIGLHRVVWAFCCCAESRHSLESACQGREWFTGDQSTPKCTIPLSTKRRSHCDIRWRSSQGEFPLM